MISIFRCSFCEPNECKCFTGSNQLSTESHEAFMNYALKMHMQAKSKIVRAFTDRFGIRRSYDINHVTMGWQSWIEIFVDNGYQREEATEWVRNLYKEQYGKFPEEDIDESPKA